MQYTKDTYLQLDEFINKYKGGSFVEMSQLPFEEVLLLDLLIKHHPEYLDKIDEVHFTDCYFIPLTVSKYKSFQQRYKEYSDSKKKSSRVQSTSIFKNYLYLFGVTVYPILDIVTYALTGFGLIDFIKSLFK